MYLPGELYRHTPSKTQGLVSLLAMLLALRNACLVSLLFTGEWITNSVWVYKLETLWDEENSKEHQKRNFKEKHHKQTSRERWREHRKDK